jgi:peptidoglycan-associated lipoprotein
VRLSLVGLASIMSLLAACSTTKAPAPAAPSAPVASTGVAPTAPAPAAAPDPSDASALAARLRAARDDLNSRSVLFDFDNFVVKPSYDAMLHQQADFLKSNATDHLALQGNADERGGAEYNLALGQKRADAVRKALVDMGAPAAHIEATSFGSEKPKATCHDESCWSQNRRVDFVHSDRH